VNVSDGNVVDVNPNPPVEFTLTPKPEVTLVRVTGVTTPPALVSWAVAALPLPLVGEKPTPEMRSLTPVGACAALRYMVGDGKIVRVADAV